MFTLCQIAFLILLGVLSDTICHAQATGARRLISFGSASGLTDDTLYLDIDQDIAVQLIPFDELMKIAILHSPVIKYQKEVSNSLNSAYHTSKVIILQNATGFGNYAGGNQTILATGAVVPGSTARPGEAIGQIANGYRVGIDVRLSLYDLFGRKHQIREAQANYRASILQKDIIEMQLKRELITVYQDMITSQQVLKLRLVDEQASLAAYRIAEVELQKGRVNADVLASATSRYIETKSASEQVKGDFLKNIRYFETMVGVPVQRLKRN
ncbi:TolC family protein [Spirosoma arcticum]